MKHSVLFVKPATGLASVNNFCGYFAALNLWSMLLQKGLEDNRGRRMNDGFTL